MCRFPFTLCLQNRNGDGCNVIVTSFTLEGPEFKMVSRELYVNRVGFFVCDYLYSYGFPSDYKRYYFLIRTQSRNWSCVCEDGRLGYQ